MEVYIYQAELLCADCARGNITELQIGGIEDTGDSDDYPQGPSPNGGGESDCPNHCGQCGRFLKNPLTTDGENYVKDQIADRSGDPYVEAKWREFYSYLWDS